MTNPRRSEAITDTHLQLYLAGLMPWPRALMLKAAIFISSPLRARFHRLRQENARYKAGEMPQLRQKLGLIPKAAGSASANRDDKLPERSRKPQSETGSPAPHRPIYQKSHTPIWSSTRKMGWALTGCTALLLAGLYTGLNFIQEPGTGPMYAAKGQSLGIHLYIKDKAGQRLASANLTASIGDTLQVLPFGEGEQYVCVYGWSMAEGLTRLYPEADTQAPIVSKGALPPALIPDTPPVGRLICVSSTRPFSISQIETILSAPPLYPMESAPSSYLKDNLYFQIFDFVGAQE